MASAYSDATIRICGIEMIWENIINQLNNSEENITPMRITLEQYELWKKYALFDGLRGIRFGQSFCNSFDITDNILFFTMNHVDADEYIRKIYIG